MFDTLKLMNSCISKKYEDTPFEELVKIYQSTTNDKVHSAIVSTTFCRLFPMLFKIYNQFPTVPSEAKVEWILFSIMRIYRFWGTKGEPAAKFTTYLYGIVRNHINTEINVAKCKKRQTEKKLVYKEATDGSNLHVNNASSFDGNRQTREFLENLKQATNLSSDEKEYCACVLAGYTKNEEIEEKMNFNTRFNDQKMSNPLNEKRIKKRTVSDIRRSLKKKFNVYDRDLFYI